MKSLLLFALLVLPAVIFTLDGGNRMMAYAEEDPWKMRLTLRVRPISRLAVRTRTRTTLKRRRRRTPKPIYSLLNPSSPVYRELELPAGVPVEFLVGFRNKGKQDFVLDTVEASFRYPMDFNFYIQNFSAIRYNREVAPSQEATLAYSFVPSEAFAGRPFGLNINLNYRDASGGAFQEAVYNETVQIVEFEEGLDGETFFLYLFLAAGFVLLLVIGQQTLLSVGRKRTSRKAPVETGTSNPNNVDYEWLPKQTLANINKLQKSRSRANREAEPEAAQGEPKHGVRIATNPTRLKERQPQLRS